jgi:hypothetical protein
MPSITSWTRLEPRTRNVDLEEGLQARVRDAAWLLARQWQLGEFRGEDAGSPIVARIEGTCARLTCYRPGAPGAPVAPYTPASLPLETLAEREALRGEGGARLRRAAEEGIHFARLLEAREMTRYVAPFRLSFPIAPPGAAEERTLDPASLRYQRVVAGRIIDGEAVYTAMRQAFPRGGGGMLPAEPAVLPEHRVAVTAVVQDWLRWAESLFSEPPPASATSWDAERMEYRFAVGARVGAEAITLTAREYQEGRLDWYSFDALKDASLAPPPDAQSLAAESIPAPVRYPGVPAGRWWEFEDAPVDFGALAASPDDLGRLLVMEHVLVYGNDWFLVPLVLPVGGVCRIARMVVTDTFGEETLVPFYAQTQAADAPWRMFTLSPDSRADAGSAPPRDLFFLPPTLGLGLEGPPVEEVLLLRDETANLAWAVERVVEGASGRAVNRYEAARAEERRAQAAGAPSSVTAPDPATLLYRLETDPPDYWIPLVTELAEETGAGHSLRLRRGVMATLLTGGTPSEPRGRLLTAARPLLLYAEEVPRSGARVTRAYQYARWMDGSTHVWVGRRKGPGRGEGASGMRFDVADPRPTQA